MSTPTSSPTSMVFLRPVSGQPVFADGSQLYASADQGPSVWSVTTQYALGNHVVGSDGKVYVAEVAGLLNVNPVGDSAVHWQNLW